jgi:putative hydrolase of the HAD superfamily
MKYRHLFFDLDHTLWDFETNSRITLEQLYREHGLKERGVDDFERFHQCYLLHNDRLWEKYRNGQLKVDILRWKRFWLALLDFKIADEPLSKVMAISFLELLPTRTVLFPYAIEVLDHLKRKGYQMHLITNGFEKTQLSKLEYSGIAPYFLEIITSEGSNSLKPHKAIFDFAMQKAKADPGHSIMIGDDAEVDIRGAMSAGIDQVFVNYKRKEIDFKPTFMVYGLKELLDIF